MRITTSRPPDLPLLRYSIAGSLAAHRPFVVTFATPKFCTSRTCGPVVDVVEAVRRRFEPRGIRFIHVEVFTGNDPNRGYNRWMRQWGLASEPWVFLVGADGRVRHEIRGAGGARDDRLAVLEGEDRAGRPRAAQQLLETALPVGVVGEQAHGGDSVGDAPPFPRGMRQGAHARLGPSDYAFGGMPQGPRAAYP